MAILGNLIQKFLRAGIKVTDSPAKARAIRISNLITATAIFNCMAFGLLFLFLRDFHMLRACLYAALLYSFANVFLFMGFPDLGRSWSLISGNLVVFWFACHFRGDGLLQLFFFSLSVMPFMYFSWEERAWYSLTLLSVVLIVLGESYSYSFFAGAPPTSGRTALRIFSMLAPLSQILAGFQYFLKQSTNYERENNENLKKLDVEYQKRLQVQKMSSLGEMASGIAHEINNPLAIISMRSALIRGDLKTRLPESDSVFSGFDKITETIQRIVKIIDALRSFSRDATQDPSQNLEIEKVVLDTLELCRQRFESAGIELRVDLQKGLIVRGRSVELSQVLLNLLINAFDAVSGLKDARVELRSRRLSDGQVEVIVEDNGPGIPEATRDKIFQPFFTTKEVGKGTGLGLSVSTGIIEGHHGKLSLISGTGKTTFQIVLPTS